MEDVRKLALDGKKPNAFTVRYNGLVNVLVTSVGVSRAFNPYRDSGVSHPEIKTFNAIWDTGASGSVISQKVVGELGLKPTGFARIHHANGESTVHTYSVNIMLPNGVAVSTLRVTEGILNDTDVLIGMDVIARGDFAVTAVNGKTVFSFQMPSTHDIDFVGETSISHMPVAGERKVGRNEPCPCGSGKKYKQCCGKK